LHDNFGEGDEQRVVSEWSVDRRRREERRPCSHNRPLQGEGEGEAAYVRTDLRESSQGQVLAQHSPDRCQTGPTNHITGDTVTDKVLVVTRAVAARCPVTYSRLVNPILSTSAPARAIAPSSCIALFEKL